MTWISNNKKIVDWLYSCRKNDTFAVKYGKNLELTKYATLSRDPYRGSRNYYETSLAEPYNIVVEIEVRKDPSADFSEKHKISHNPDSNDLYVKKGVGRFEEVKSICTKALEADYGSDRNIVAECQECGTQTKLKMEDNNNQNRTGMKKSRNGDTITPCCFSENWETKLSRE